MQITKQGLEKLKKELLEFRANRREISLRIKQAKELGDLSENAEYKEAKDAQALNESHIAELNNKIREAVIVEGGKSERAQIGVIVKVRSAQGIQEFAIVSGNEVDPVKNKISDESPLAKAFIGHKAGDKVEAELPSKKMHYEILEIK